MNAIRAEIARYLMLLLEGDVGLANEWLDTPHSELGGRSPHDVIAEGRADVVRDMLAAAYAGIPT